MKTISFYTLGILFLIACSAFRLEEISIDIEKHTVFNAGDDEVNSYRIPSIVTATDGTLLVFCEARRESWRDKSRTDIVLKRSTDGGKTWSNIQDLTQDSTGAYMDPTPIVDTVTGRIFLFTTFWPADDHSGMQNRAYLLTSDDHGKTWTTPKDITDKLLPKGSTPNGFGPGSGLQMQGNAYKDRLILPMRISDAKGRNTHDVTVYSDDHGTTWHFGDYSDANNEFQIAESPHNTLIYNARISNGRLISRSTDGGITWEKSVKDAYLPGVSKGCQASVLGDGANLYFTGIEGIAATDEFDERARLMLYTSRDGGVTWEKGKLLYERASGYSCITKLSDGRLAVIFETADDPAFTRKSIEGTNPPKRPVGWMKLDIILLQD